MQYHLYERMTEKKKIIILILSCVTMLICLCGIQYSLVMNTFYLTKDKYKTEVTQLVNDAEKNKNIRALLNKSNADIEQLFYAISAHKIDKRSFLRQLDSITRHYEENMRRYFRQAAKDKTALKVVLYKLTFTDVLLHERTSADTLIGANKKLEALKENQDDYTDLNIFRSSTADLGPRIQRKNPDRYPRLTYERTEHIRVTDWKKEVFWRMFVQTVFATAIFFSMVFLFYTIIRVLIRQRKLGEMKTDFANNISHELKTPLSSIGIIAKSLLRTEITHDPETVAELAELLQRQQAKMELTFNRIMETTLAEKGVISTYVTDLTAFLNNYAAADADNGKQTFYEIEQKEMVITTNMLVIENALDNLLENAKKYSAPESKINVRAYAGQSQYHIEVTDQGRGIEKKYQKLIFEKFYRITEKDLHTVKGLGLGLFLSQQSLKHIHADLRLKASSAEGSTFTITLNYGH